MTPEEVVEAAIQKVQEVAKDFIGKPPDLQETGDRIARYWLQANNIDYLNYSSEYDGHTCHITYTPRTPINYIEINFSVDTETGKVLPMPTQSEENK